MTYKDKIFNSARRFKPVIIIFISALKNRIEFADHCLIYEDFWYFI